VTGRPTVAVLTVGVVPDAARAGGWRLSSSLSSEAPVSERREVAGRKARSARGLESADETVSWVTRPTAVPSIRRALLAAWSRVSRGCSTSNNVERGWTTAKIGSGGVHESSRTTVGDARGVRLEESNGNRRRYIELSFTGCVQRRRSGNSPQRREATTPSSSGMRVVDSRGAPNRRHLGHDCIRLCGTPSWKLYD